MRLVKKIETFDQEDLKILADDSSTILKVMLIGTASIVVLFLIFGNHLLFSHKLIDQVISWGFIGIPVLILAILVLFKKIDLWVGKKQIVTGVITNIKQYREHNSGGFSDQNYYYVYIDKKRFTIDSELFRKVTIGKQVNLHRTFVLKKVFRIT